MLNIVFMGTPDFAVPSLKALHNYGHNVIVVTQPDRPVGRGNKIRMPAVKACALELGIPVYQYQSVKCDECIEVIRSFNPDLFVTAAFGQILNQTLLDIPLYGCINVHGSLLPKYRGAAPIQWAIINGEAVTGVTTMLTDVGLDTGDMLLSKEIHIEPDDTAASLFDKLAELGAEVLVETINKYVTGQIAPTKQAEVSSSYFPMINQQMAQIDFAKTAKEIDFFVRGMYSWPIAYIKLKEGVFKIHKMHVEDGDGECGRIEAADTTNGLKIGTASGIVVIDVIQAEGSRAMNANDYLRGHKIEVGQIANSEVIND